MAVDGELATAVEHSDIRAASVDEKSFDLFTGGSVIFVMLRKRRDRGDGNQLAQIVDDSREGAFDGGS